MISETPALSSAPRRVVPSVTMMDFMKSIKNSRSSVSTDDVNKHKEWAEQFGQDG